MPALVTAFVSPAWIASGAVKEMSKPAENLKNHGIHPVSLEERIDTTSADCELVFQVFWAIAYFPRWMISELTGDEIAAARKRGRSPARPALGRGTIPATRDVVEAGLTAGQAAKQLGIVRAVR